VAVVPIFLLTLKGVAPPELDEGRAGVFYKDVPPPEGKLPQEIQIQIYTLRR